MALNNIKMWIGVAQYLVLLSCNIQQRLIAIILNTKKENGVADAVMNAPC